MSLFPDYFRSPLGMGVVGRAIRSGLLEVDFTNPRDFTDDKYRRVDDRPFSGGDGMLLRYEPLKRAISALPSKGLVCYLSPQGRLWDHSLARQWAREGKEYTLICGRYGGIDQRVINELVDEEVSIGNYILTGGEGAVLVILDSLCRFVKGVLGNELSSTYESFENQNLLECPQWTRPWHIEGHVVPELLRSGHDGDIKRFQYFVSILLTAKRRPDLLELSDAKKDLEQAKQYASTLSNEELRACGLLP